MAKGCVISYGNERVIRQGTRQKNIVVLDVLVARQDGPTRTPCEMELEIVRARGMDGSVRDENGRSNGLDM